MVLLPPAGGSHALLNGWMNNAKLTSTLTWEQQDLINAARQASKHSRARRGFKEDRQRERTC